MRDITPAQIRANNQEAQRILAEKGIETDELYPLSVQKRGDLWCPVNLRTGVWGEGKATFTEAQADAAALKCELERRCA